MATDDEGRVLLLEREAAEELLQLVADEPGEADEDLLDEVLRAIEVAEEQLDGEAQQRVASGEAVAFAIDDDDALVVSALVRENVERDETRLRSVARRLKTKLGQARKRARRS